MTGYWPRYLVPRARSDHGRRYPVQPYQTMSDVPTRVGYDPLPSWNASRARTAILDFVARVTERGGFGYVPPADRIAVFDNDGTLWCEMPRPVQAAFATDRLRTLVAENPEWRETEPYRSALAEDAEALRAQGPSAIAKLATATHAGMTTDEFSEIVRTWLATSRHPQLGLPYTQAVYQPMLELLALLRASGFSTYIVSGGGAEFMRVFAEHVYGIPPDQVIGSTIRTHFEERGGFPMLVRDPSVEVLDDGVQKPVAIEKFIGRRPLVCFGNSDGDREMLLWTTVGRKDAYRGLGMLVHHTDNEREYRYDREPLSSGHLSRALDEAPQRGWVVIDMKADWRAVFPSRPPGDDALPPLAG
jgi:phosphoserine phosphatase